MEPGTVIAIIALAASGISVVFWVGYRFSRLEHRVNLLWDFQRRRGKQEKRDSQFRDYFPEGDGEDQP